MIHESLECGGSVTKSKEHDSGFKQSHGSDKGGLPLVLFLNVDVVVSPMNVELGKQDRLCHIIDKFWDER